MSLKPSTDDEIAKVVMKKHKFIHNPSLGIMEYNGRYWQSITDEQCRKYIGQEYSSVRTLSKLNSVLGLIKADTVTDKIPNEKPLINFVNGTFEIETGNLREHNENDFLSYELPYPYNPNAQVTGINSSIQFSMILRKFNCFRNIRGTLYIQQTYYSQHFT